jgi:hypothetical protein
MTYIINECKNNDNFNLLMNVNKTDLSNVINWKLKPKLGFINSKLSSYGVKISNSQIRETGLKHKTNVYNLHIIDNVDELILYKLLNGFVLCDKSNIFKPPFNVKNYDFKYIHLTTFKNIEELKEIHNKQQTTINFNHGLDDE